MRCYWLFSIVGTEESFTSKFHRRNFEIWIKFTQISRAPDFLEIKLQNFCLKLLLSEGTSLLLSLYPFIHRYTYWLGTESLLQIAADCLDDLRSVIIIVSSVVGCSVIRLLKRIKYHVYLNLDLNANRYSLAT